MARTRSQEPLTPTKQTAVSASPPKTPRTPKKAAPKPSDFKIKKPIPKPPTLKKKTEEPSPTPITPPPTSKGKSKKKKKKSTKKQKPAPKTKWGVYAHMEEHSDHTRFIVHAPRYRKRGLDDAVTKALKEVVLAAVTKKDRKETEKWFEELGMQRKFKKVAVLFRLSETPAEERRDGVHAIECYPVSLESR